MFSSCPSLALSALYSCRSYLTRLQRIRELFIECLIYFDTNLYKLLKSWWFHAFQPFMYNDLSFVFPVCQL